MLEGRLGDFTLPDVLKLLAYTSKSGRLSLRHGDVGAYVALHEGQVVAASADERRLTALRRIVASGAADPRAVTDLLDRSGAASDDTALVAALVERGEVAAATAAEVVRGASVDAVGELMAWTEGTFRFEPAEVVLRSMEGSVLRVDTLLAELDSRDADEGFPQLLLDDDAVVELSVPGSSGQVVLASEAWALLSRLGGRRRLRELVDASGLGGSQVRRLLAPLVAEGIVSVTPAGAADDMVGAADRVLERIAHLEGAHPADGYAWPSGQPASPRTAEAASGRGDPGVVTGAASAATGGSAPRATPSALPGEASVPDATSGPDAGGVDEAVGSGPRYRPPPLAEPAAGTGGQPTAASGQVGSSLRAALEDLEALNGVNDTHRGRATAGGDGSGRAPSSSEPATPGHRDQPTGDVPRPLGHGVPARATTNAAADAPRPGDTAGARPDGVARRLQLDPTIDQDLLDKLIRHLEAI